MHFSKILTVVLSVVFLQQVSGAALDKLFAETCSCEASCKSFFADYPKSEVSCKEGCRLYTMVSLAKGTTDANKTVELCVAGCTEAFKNATERNACHYACSVYPPIEEGPQTLHLLVPLMYVKSAYKTVTRHVKHFISTRWAVYVQEDPDTVIVQTSPKMIESLEISMGKDQDNDRDYQPEGQDSGTSDWMDCLSQQSGIPRWLIVAVLFGFVFALLWLCCATTATAPNHYVSSKKRDMGYLVVCSGEPDREFKMPLLPPEYTDKEKQDEDQAPPLPPKVSLI